MRKDVESSLRGFVRRSIQHGSSRGQGAPGIGHSRSNSHSNSMTRELPVPRETPLNGILTRPEETRGKSHVDLVIHRRLKEGTQSEKNFADHARFSSIFSRLHSASAVGKKERHAELYMRKRWQSSCGEGGR
ncbi:hypothetical protein KP509_16G011800 [Ceratopteris richardii]|uniref:Uncharacterized protein n=1 Tax=Ceratopteris richardii TaxID=49495 RepID=A0A8T2T2B3_CERRI|nr:hypothetical protein KP509_16G011800 [Ceratopteris richardii]